MNVSLFALVCLIWGSTWLAIVFQVGDVPVLVSVFYRFAIAALLYVLVLLFTRKISFPELRHHPFIAAQAFCLFSVNFVLFYNSSMYIPSGLIAVIFSLSTIFNIFNARCFFGDSITLRHAVASLLGLTGLSLIFLPSVLLEISQSASSDTAYGVLLATTGTFLFSLGNMASRRNSSHNLQVSSVCALSMAYGAAGLMLFILLTSTPIVAPPTLTYTAALLYLAIFGSIIGFTAYLSLIERIGSSSAAYTTVLFPIVATLLSALFEGFEIQLITLVGILIASSGNVVMFSKINLTRSWGNEKQAVSSQQTSRASP